ncbi:type VI secretion system accessory protein TagJ [Cupriavidus basilensis]
MIDSDSRLGQTCEIFLGGRYFWIPFDIICEVNLAPVMSLVDRVWRQAIVRLRSGESYAGLLPARYVGTQFADDDLKLGQTTLWIQLGGALQAGLGERQFRCDRGAQWRISRLTVIRFDANAGGRAMTRTFRTSERLIVDGCSAVAGLLGAGWHRSMPTRPQPDLMPISEPARSVPYCLVPILGLEDQLGARNGAIVLRRSCQYELVW